MQFQVSFETVISALALSLSAYSTFMTIRFNNRQKALIESQEQLNALLMEKEKSDVNAAKKAEVGAAFVKTGSSRYKLRIWNKGKATARNIDLKFPDGNEVLIPSELEAKFPLEALEAHHSVELIAAVHMGTKAKHTIKLTWSDEISESNEKVVYLTL